MTGKTHMICSTAAVAAYAFANPAGIQVHGVDINPWVSIISTAVGAFLPDMDIEQSRLGQKFKLLSKNMKHRGFTHTLVIPAVLLLATLCIQSKLASILTSITVGILVGLLFNKKGGTKRGSTPKRLWTLCCNQKGLTTTAVMLVLTHFFPNTGASLLFGLFAGWTLHIFEDLFNYKGCPIFWPIAKGHIHVACFKTRHWTEAVFAFLWLGGCLTWALSTAAGRL